MEQLNWDGEPATIEDLMHTYQLEAKAAGRWGGTTLFLVESKTRSGKKENITEGQEYKLFLASCMNLMNILFYGHAWHQHGCKITPDP